MKVIKKKEEKRNRLLFRVRFSALASPFSLPLFASQHNWENNGTSLPSISDYFNFAQVPSRLAKRDEFPGGSRLVSFFIERFAYHGFFCFAFCTSTYLPNNQAARLLVFLSHFAPTSAGILSRHKGSTISYRIAIATFLHLKHGTKTHVESAQIFPETSWHWVNQSLNFLAIHSIYSDSFASKIIVQTCDL